MHEYIQGVSFAQCRRNAIEGFPQVNMKLSRVRRLPVKGGELVCFVALRTVLPPYVLRLV